MGPTPNERATSKLSFDIWVDPPGLTPHGGAPLCVCAPLRAQQHELVHGGDEHLRHKGVRHHEV